MSAVTQQRIAEELKSEREALTAYLRSIPEAAWDKESLCDGWTIKDLMAHVVGIASDVANRRLDGVGSPEQNERQVSERKDATPSDLLDEWSREGKLLEDGILELDEAFWTAPYTEGFNVGQALQRMVEDIWVHAQDVRIPLGDEATKSAGTISTLEVGSRELGIRLPAYAPDVGTLTIDVGDYSSETKGAGSTDVRITGDAVALALVQTGRISLENAIRNKQLDVEPVVDGLAKALNFYAP
jgi:uncharacterized protein (TIGR03083 family)